MNCENVLDIPCHKYSTFGDSLNLPKFPTVHDPYLKQLEENR